MIFTKRLRDRVRSGEIQSSIRIWQSARVKAGHRYQMEEGQIEVDSISQIEMHDITPALARASGFAGVVDLLKVAKHGSGEKVYLVRFRYVPPTLHAGDRVGKSSSAKKSKSKHSAAIKKRRTKAKRSKL